MKRLAFIIGSDQSVYGLLRGVGTDHSNYRSFLTSNAGGAWEHDEIHDMGRPEKNDLLAAIAVGVAFDFVLLVFAGHGYCTMKNNETHVCVNDREDVAVRELHSWAPRQVNIIDSCREYHRFDEELRRSEREVLAGAEDPRAALMYRQSCRALYDQAALFAEPGVETLYAASVGQAAGDSPQGGLFSTMLIGTATAWSNERRLSVPRAMFTLGVDMALAMAEQRMAERRWPQIPVGTSNPRSQHFPFAVA